MICANLFVPNAPFLYPLKMSENRKVFGCFQGVEKGCIGNECVKRFIFAQRASKTNHKVNPFIPRSHINQFCTNCPF